MNPLISVLSKFSSPLVSIISSVSPVAGLIVKGLMNLFGVETGSTEDLAKAIATDKDAALKIKQYEIEHADIIAQTTAQIRLAAYDREKTIVQSTGKRDWVMDFLAVFVTVTFVGLCLIVAFGHMDPGNRDLFYMLLGTFSAAWGGIVAYFFGGNPSTALHSHKEVKKSPEIILPPPADTK